MECEKGCLQMLAGEISYKVKISVAWSELLVSKVCNDFLAFVVACKGFLIRVAVEDACSA